jgi:hypothetical protein
VRDHHEQLPEDLEAIGSYLRAARLEATPLELDQLKQRVLARAGRPRRVPLRGRLVTALLAVGLLASSSGAVVASVGQDDGPRLRNVAARSQYCPPPTPGTGEVRGKGYGAIGCGEH